MNVDDLNHIYLKGTWGSLSELWQAIRVLKAHPDSLPAVQAAFRAAHTLKGSSWTMRDVPCYVNDDPPDLEYDEAARVAEELESYLGDVLSNGQTPDLDKLSSYLVRLEMCIAQITETKF
jgi:hypothetical protein